MSQLVVGLFEILSITTVASESAITTVRPLVIPGANNDYGTCPPRSEREAAIQTVKTTINLMYTLENASQYDIVCECGTGPWYSVAHLNMRDPSQLCPPTWREYNRSGVRACGRPTSSGGSCPATHYVTNGQYSRVCGRAIGYQIGSPDAFAYNAQGQNIDSYYVYGLSITHGTPRNHIWTYAAGFNEGVVFRSHCPCVDPPSHGPVLPPSFVDDHYYYPLWDGKQCRRECCSNGKSPPWFSVELTNPTTNDIEVRICNGEGTDEDVTVQLLELYIQ